MKGTINMQRNHVACVCVCVCENLFPRYMVSRSCITRMVMKSHDNMFA